MNLSVRFEVTKQEYIIGEITHVNGGYHGTAKKAMLGHDQHRHDPLLVQVSEQLMHLHGQKPLFGHRIEIAVEAVNQDQARIVLIDCAPDCVSKFARRQLGRIYLLDRN